MTGHYDYTPCIWPMVASPALLLVPGAYARRHRSAPGARPFVAFVLSIVRWAAGAALELAAVDPPTKIRRYVLQGVWQLPTATAALWFALEYADLGRRCQVNLLTHRAVVFSSQSERLMTTDDLLRVIEGRTGTATKKT